MTGSDRFVADTNVLISFILRPNSTPGRAVTTALAAFLHQLESGELKEEERP